MTAASLRLSAGYICKTSISAQGQIRQRFTNEIARLTRFNRGLLRMKLHATNALRFIAALFAALNMNQIAAQIDQAADILRATNDLLEARANHRQAQAHGNVHKVIDAYVKVVEAERYLAQMYPAETVEYTAPDCEPLPDCGETKDEHADYYGRNRSYRTEDERLDDPRRYEVTK